MRRRKRRLLAANIAAYGGLFTLAVPYEDLQEVYTLFMMWVITLTFLLSMRHIQKCSEPF